MYRNDKDQIEDSFQAYLVEGASFTKDEEYPVLENWMVPTDLPTIIMPFSKAIRFRGDLSKVVVCFYSPDSTFERVRRNPRRYLSFFKRCQGIIGFDFSVHTDMQRVKQKAQINDNLSLSYYYGAHGIPIYPNGRGGSDTLNEEFLSALPMHSYIALGVSGFAKRTYQKAEWRVWIGRLIERLHPKGFVVVGHLPKDIIQDYQDETLFHVYDSFMEQRYQEVIKDANQRAK